MAFLGQHQEPLAADDGRAILAAIFDEPGLKVPNLSSTEARAVWIYLNHETVYRNAIELLDYDKRFQKEACWNGFEIGAALDPDKLDPEDPVLIAALAECFKSAGRPPPDLIIHAFRRSSPRSDSRAVHITLSFAGDPEAIWTIKNHKRHLETLNRERLAAVVIDHKARTIDPVADLGGVGLRKKLLRAVLSGLSVQDAETIPIAPRWVNWKASISGAICHSPPRTGSQESALSALGWSERVAASSVSTPAMPTRTTRGPPGTPGQTQGATRSEPPRLSGQCWRSSSHRLTMK